MTYRNNILKYIKFLFVLTTKFITIKRKFCYHNQKFYLGKEKVTLKYLYISLFQLKYLKKLNQIFL